MMAMTTSNSIRVKASLAGPVLWLVFP